MKKLVWIVLLISGIVANGFSAESLADKIKFASVGKANALLTQEDEYTRSWSQFDIDSRLHKLNSTKEELFGFIKKQTREWTLDEKNMILEIFKSVDNQIKSQGFDIPAPAEVYFVKSTAEEEGGAGGYTRGNCVVLKNDILTQSKENLTKTIVHELFHILTRKNPDFRKAMYGVIGFHLMNDVPYPESLKASRITNPDAPQTDSYIRLKVDGQSKDCMMILYANQAYTGGEFFRYLNVGFLGLTGDSVKSVEYIDNKPVIYEFVQVSGFFEQVGNTNYIIHPEEILADNFVFAILNKTGLSKPKIVNDIKKILQTQL